MAQSKSRSESHIPIRPIGMWRQPSCVCQEVEENVAGNVFDQWVDQPSEYLRESPAQCDRFVLNIYAPILFFDSPVVVEAPQVTMVVPIATLVFVCTAWIRDFGDAR